MEFLIPFAILAWILFVFGALFIAWGIMRALERLAHAAELEVRLKTPNPSAGFRAEKVTNNRLYKEFLAEDDERVKLPAKERHDAFRQWLDSMTAD